MFIRNLILVDPQHKDQFKPLSWTRPLAAFRFGILSIMEKWALRFHAETSHCVSFPLSDLYPAQIQNDNFVVQGHLIPNNDLCYLISNLQEGEFLVCDDLWVAGRLNKQQCLDFLQHFSLNGFNKQFVDKHLVNGIYRPWELFQRKAIELEQDYQLITAGRFTTPIHESNAIIGNQLFVEEGARMMACTLNSQTGPIYIGRNVEIMEGSMLRGPLAICEGSIVKMGAKIYGATSIGPESRIGGEINNCIFQAYSNKAHDGFLGNSIIGEWVNIGADTNASNLKNNYEDVKLWNYNTKRFDKTASLFCGLIMGDHAKCGINTMFNTGTVVGFGANVFGAGFPRQFVPDFAWGGASGFSTFTLDKFFATAQKVMERRHVPLTDSNKKLFEYIFSESREFRNWDSI
ncbi:MAG: glucose-1-phosphate thymidylyltransferase [Saprospiraceae bacterium]|nr:glucose-1-phosphate thymidylyltransferase [Saprospiraceae bacterium]